MSIQILDGNSSIWSTPWFPLWHSIYDHLQIQPGYYAYPSQIKDLWMQNQKTWNADLIYALFDYEAASSILQIPIIQHQGEDILCWTLHPSGKCTSKSAYRVCLQDMQQCGFPSPRQPPQRIKNLLRKVWKEKTMVPRVQAFSWRLLRGAIPTGMRAGRFSINIKKECIRCNQPEDDMHLFFTCPFVKAVWILEPWYINSEILSHTHTDIPHILHDLLNSNHPQASLINIMTFLWCIWKARNDALFARKNTTPRQVYQATQAILKNQELAFQ